MENVCRDLSKNNARAGSKRNLLQGTKKPHQETTSVGERAKRRKTSMEALQRGAREGPSYICTPLRKKRNSAEGTQNNQQGASRGGDPTTKRTCGASSDGKTRFKRDSVGNSGEFALLSDDKCRIVRSEKQRGSWYQTPNDRTQETKKILRKKKKMGAALFQS